MTVQFTLTVEEEVDKKKLSKKELKKLKKRVRIVTQPFPLDQN